MQPVVALVAVVFSGVLYSTVSTERCMDKVQRTGGTGFQESHPSGVTQDVPETPNSELFGGTCEMLPSRESR